MKMSIKVLTVVLAVGFMFGLAGLIKAANTVNLGTAGNFAVLAGSTITNTGNSVVNGKLGLNPGTSVTGFPPGTVNGTTQVANAVAVQAQTDLTTAYNAVTSQACDTDLTSQDLGGLTLTPGVYCFSSSAQLTGMLTLNAQGDPDAVFIFKIGSSLTTAPGSEVKLINEAQSCHVFWQIGSSATLDSTTIFKGNILALASITLVTGANVEGSVLARNGAVTLDTNTITKAVCSTPPNGGGSGGEQGDNSSTTISNTVTTDLTKDTTSGAKPIVKASFIANYPDRYTDASTDAGTQLLPSGQYQVNKRVSICGVITDPDGLADVKQAYTDVFYPEGIALGASHVALADQPQNAADRGCGKFMQEDSLVQLPKAEGIALFCDKVKNLNNNLPTFNPNYSYAEICGETGELQKDTAAVYCGWKDISYEDPAGSYKTWVLGQDPTGLGEALNTSFTYLPITAFQTDFSSIVYGNVKLNTHKIIAGDLTWDTTTGGRASVRNVGNTRLTMQVWQNDMGLGKTDGQWNVKFDARVGSYSPYAVYSPEVTTPLVDSLDLSELDEMDFSIDVAKFRPDHAGDVFSGSMTLSAVTAPHLVCNN